MDIETISHLDYLALEKAFADFRADPKRYRARLGIQVILSYFLLLLVLAIPVAMLFSRFFIWGILILGAFLLSSLRLLWTPKPPGSLLLDRRKHARLYRLVNRLALLAGGPRIDRIYLDMNFNASAGEMRYGLPPRWRPFMTVGYPLLAAETRRGMISILAHEAGHLAARHSRRNRPLSTAWELWSRLRPGILIFLIPLQRIILRRFVIAIMPILRRHEEEADRFAVSRVGEADFAAGMLLTDLRHGFYAEPEPREEITPEAAEHFDYAGFIRDQVRRPLPYPCAGRNLKLLQSRRANCCDTHPPFRERTGEISEELFRSILDAVPDALETLLPEHCEVEGQLNADLRKFMPEALNGRFRALQAARKKLEAYPPEELPEAKAGAELLAALSELDRHEEYQELAARLNAAYPDDAGIQFQAAGAMLFDCRPKDAIAVLHRLLENDPAYIDSVNPALVNAYLLAGDSDGLAAFLKLREVIFEKLKRGIDDGVGPLDGLTAAEVEPELAERLTPALGKHKEIVRVWVVCRPVLPGSKRRIRFALVEFKTLSFSFSDENTVLNGLQAAFGEDGLFFRKKPWNFRDRLSERLPESRFYPRGPSPSDPTRMD